MFSKDNSVIVIDNGSYCLKAGFAGQDQPQGSFPSLVGQKRSEVYLGHADRYVGYEAQCKREVLNIVRPFENRIITNWDAFENILHHTFYNELKVKPDEGFVLLTEAMYSPKVNREKMAQIMFETFNIGGMWIALQSVLSLQASGRVTGLVLDAGYEVTYIVPIYEGYVMPHAVGRIDLGGRHLTDYLHQILEEHDDTFSHQTIETVRDIKEKLCYIASDFQQEMDNFSRNVSSQKTYVLPDGRSIAINNEMFRCPEAMFEPSLVGVNCHGVHTAIWDAISKTDSDIRKELSANIVLSGGTSMFDGLKERLQKEISQVSPLFPIEIVSPSCGLNSAWVGGSILASCCRECTQSMWVLKEEYEECGVQAIHKL